MTLTLDSDLYLGFDLSTQQLKVIVTNSKLKHLKTYHVEFDAQYAEKYNINKGVVTNGKEVVSLVAVWLESIDYVLNDMKKDFFPFDRVAGISGSCQQHGSVFWSQEASSLLSNLSPESTLNQQLSSNAFAIPISPNWQDHSTGQELKIFEEVVGGKENLATMTGSKAHYRFTGLQIRKISTRSHVSQFKQTSRISLVSSFLASVLLGKITEIEEGDACGMNLYDMGTNDYNDELLALAAGVHMKQDGASKEEFEKGVASLRSKLGPIIPVSHNSIGLISPYYIQKYGFSAKCKVYSFTGDNLATILSLPLQKNDLLISLGTSTTVLLITESFNASPQYHLFKHPTLKKSYMGMICYCNGSLARENVNNELNAKYHTKDWEKFNEILNQSSNNEFSKQLGVYFPLGEIVPNVPSQTKRFTLSFQHESEAELEEVSEWEVEKDVLSIIESQSLSCRLRAGPMINCPHNPTSSTNSKSFEKLYQDLTSNFGTLVTDDKPQTSSSILSRPNKCYFVGGASKNDAIVKKMASILGAVNGNFKADIPNACALGGAYKASWSHYCEEVGYVDYDKYLEERFGEDELARFDVDNKWESYFDGLGMLSLIESKLEH